MEHRRCPECGSKIKDCEMFFSHLLTNRPCFGYQVESERLVPVPNLELEGVEVLVAGLLVAPCTVHLDRVKGTKYRNWAVVAVSPVGEMMIARAKSRETIQDWVTKAFGNVEDLK